MVKQQILPWGVIFPNVGTFARHPSQIYEAILEGIVLFILINFFALKKQLLLKTGYVSGLFLIFYSIARIIGENFREPDKHLGYFFNYFSMGIMLSFVTFLAGCFIIFSYQERMKKIINILKEKKSIPLDQFINISLYDKKFGYYMKKNPFGKGGDFITAPLSFKSFWRNVSNMVYCLLGKYRKTKKNFIS